MLAIIEPRTSVAADFSFFMIFRILAGGDDDGCTVGSVDVPGLSASGLAGGDGGGGGGGGNSSGGGGGGISSGGNGG